MFCMKTNVNFAMKTKRMEKESSRRMEKVYM